MSTEQKTAAWGTREASEILAGVTPGTVTFPGLVATDAPKPEFIVPPGFDGGDLVPVIHYRESTGQVCSISASEVVRLIRQESSWREAARIDREMAERERNKVRRLMAALAEEVTK